jgi:hypothetical protein
MLQHRNVVRALLPHQRSAIVRIWNRTPLMRKLSILAAMTAKGERADLAVGKLVALAGLMASFLSAEQRVNIASQLRQEADALAPNPERRLH